MDYTNFNMRLDNDLRRRAYPILEQYGLTPSQAVRMFFNQIAQTGKIPLSFDWAENQTLTPKAAARLRQTEQEFANGEFERFNSLDELNQAIKEISHG
ncbi:type II toxin-antitoxin system RelB/DinJ family antitoxin [Histophilus somni]|uniref:Type II toxin-antitoxin system RelB/DinJ family antitoxin n=1 Tax=Histophilus somni TaxID=731 RepID=A0AAX2S0D3_HISSO|nr:type II toxin-antitoxin system RelB/DinJ family antitoxin [Histophilus somni]QEH08926.1 type II toxin-antitoxin system RelB/DinJ family antitoxin [Histophilus somni]QEH12492.1 type II toxin-antitoxin system RelB/DinJ family antitoxin [Histophilus somni]QEH25199.1 type II toxin-antitoxin system RelB/DinJ family antitoxin [Histophilus somni]QEH26975.1 type II toxin-antitoxin system RelB/DinJ family antitoxin [Histophilus somni]QEH51168.1 type II toxin-antitoxin system RelB/DinJ family antitox